MISVVIRGKVMEFSQPTAQMDPFKFEETMTETLLCEGII
jgi:hypothetical protein